MSKARTLADFISDGSTFADGAISVSEVSGAAPLASPTFTGNVDLGDNVKLRLGDSDDLQLYHDGQNSYISDQGTGNIKILANDFRIKNAADTESLIQANQNGEVYLYYNNSVKLATVTDGVDITGDVGATTATITGKTTTDELDLNAIAATISDTAVDIFVYDTRKDSDGGAWRKRTQGTSWYNETLNTATRGSRKEFPAVAVIVVDNNGLYIYDGDDPDMPMWMKANDVASGMVLNSSNSNAVTAKNGIIALAGSSALWVMHFVDDRGDLRNAARRYDYKGNIEQRNDGLGYIDQETSGALASATVNDVAMTVLPNAPIDAATGLPVPTIAVATNGGLCAIKDDGTVTSVLGNNGEKIYAVDFVKDGTGDIWYGSDYEHIKRITLGNEVKNWWTSFDSGSPSPYSGWYGSVSGTGRDPDKVATLDANTAAAAPQQSEGFSLHRFNGTQGSGSDRFNGSPETAYISKDYNTGWMNGDIKLATLSDTDATNVTGSELITNAGPNFTNTDGWGASNGTLSVSSGDLLLTGSNTVNEHMYSTGFSLVAGQTYTLFIDSNQLFSYTRIGSTTSLATGEQLDTSTQVGLNSFTFTATTTGTFYLKLGMVTSYVTGSINSVSLRLAEEDRSVNGNGLQVFGTVTKSAVATGADLVAYSGFSSGNYLEQPVNSDLTGSYDSCFMGWIKTSSTSQYQYIFSLGSSSSDVFGLAVQITTGYLYAYDDVNSLDASSTNVADGSWHHVCLVHRNGVNKQLYVDGRLVNTSTTSSYTHSNDVKYRAGQYYTANYAWLGSLALQRFSKTIPSPEQIKKIYEDEKVLFQDNAQATLYGSSDAVTALAYDDSTNLLHVGTSAGRSVFQGLKRVDNTTTAVGAAISASNGLVADE